MCKKPFIQRTFAVLGVVLLALTGISQTTVPHKTTNPAQSKSSQPSIDLTKTRLTDLEKRVADLESKVAFYKYLIDQKQAKYDTAQLDPSTRVFQRVDSETTSFFISVQDATPYLDGYKLKEPLIKSSVRALLA